MNRICLTFFTILSFQLQAQVKLKTGMQIMTHMTSTSTSELGFGMSTNSDTEADFLMTVNEEKKNVFELTKKMTGMKMHMNMMGQESNYDSKNENDKETAAGKLLSPLIGTESKFMVNKSDGKVFPIVQKDSAKTSATALLPGVENMDESKKLEEFFFVITPQQRNAGTWFVMDSTDENLTKTIYKIDSVKQNDIYISYTLTSISTSNMEQMGMSTKVKMTSTGKGELIADLKSNLTKTNKVVLESSGSMEIADQSSDFTQKTTTITTYTIQ